MANNLIDEIETLRRKLREECERELRLAQRASTEIESYDNEIIRTLKATLQQHDERRSIIRGLIETLAERVGYVPHELSTIDADLDLALADARGYPIPSLPAKRSH